MPVASASATPSGATSSAKKANHARMRRSWARRMAADPTALPWNATSSRQLVRRSVSTGSSSVTTVWRRSMPSVPAAASRARVRCRLKACALVKATRASLEGK